MTQAELEAAISAGVKAGLAGINTSTINDTKITPPDNDDVDRSRTTNKSITKKETDSIIADFIGSEGHLGELSETSIIALEGIVKGLDHNKSKIKEITEEQLKYFFNARKELGNISYDMETGEAKMFGNTKHYVEQYEAILKDASDALRDDSLNFAEGYGETLDPLYNFFENATEAANRYGKIMEEAGSDTPRIVQEIEEAEAKRLTFFSKTLNIVESDVAAFLKRQYAYTGEASDEIIGKIGTTSKALAEATGISAHQVKEGIIAVMKDVDKFGNIGVDAAGRISAALGQLGVDFQSFQSLTDKFMNFDSAASKMGELSALFGIQMDAMEMTYLANEDQEEFLYKMREEILDAGIDVENLSNTRARALASQLNMSVTEMKTFLREGELAVDQVGLEEATSAAEEMDALTVAGRDFGDEFARANQSVLESLQEKLIPGVVEARNELYGTATEAERTATAFQKIKLPDDLNRVRKEVQGYKIDVQEMFTGGAEEAVEIVNSGLAALSSGIASTFDAIRDETEAFVDEMYGTSSNNPVVVQHQSNIADIQDAVEENQIRELENKQDVKALLAELSDQKAVIDSLMQKLENEEPIVFNVALDGETIASKTMSVLLKNGQAVDIQTL